MGMVVKTTGGEVEGVTSTALTVFKGIPFASPPEGPLRFQAPSAPPSGRASAPRASSARHRRSFRWCPARPGCGDPRTAWTA